MATKKLYIQGLNSDADVQQAEQALRDVWGIQEVTVHQGDGVATVTYDEQAASWGDFSQAVRDCGYEVSE